MPSRRSLILYSTTLIALGLFYRFKPQNRWAVKALLGFLNTYVVPLLGPVVLLLGLILVVWFIRCALWTRRETLTSFEDFSVDPVKRTDSNRVLTCLVLSHLQDPQPLRMSELQMDIMPGAEEPGFGGLRPQQPMDAIAGFVVADHPIKVATLEFNLSDILNAFRRLFDRPYRQYLQGWLFESSDSVVAVAQLLDSTKNPKHKLGQNQIWQVEITGSNARERAVADLAAQIMIAMGESNITSNWQSLRSFQAGMRQLHLRKGPNTPAANIDSARCQFEDALDHDPSNWIARFQLALILCRENQPRAALEHFEILRSILERVLNQEPRWWSNLIAQSKRRGRKLRMPGLPYGSRVEHCTDEGMAFKSLVRHLKRYPECPFLVEYNRAITMSTFHEDDKRNQAIKVLQSLAGLREGRDTFPALRRCAKRLSERSKIELQLYAKSAQACILAGSCKQADDLPQQEAEIRKLLGQIEKLCFQRQEHHWRSLQTARAVTLSALARVLAAQQKVKESCDCLYQALAAEPKFVDAYQQLATLHMEKGEALSKNWESLAKSWEKRVEEINPDCRNATVLPDHLRHGKSIARRHHA